MLYEIITAVAEIIAKYITGWTGIEYSSLAEYYAYRDACLAVEGVIMILVAIVGAGIIARIAYEIAYRMEIKKLNKELSKGMDLA